ncbi:MAG: divalent-cation tolerance protein CutA [Pseudomonadota bacterium]
MTDLLLVWVNCASRAEAKAIANAAVERRLAASANILPSIESIFFWEGAARDGAETPLVLRTRQDLFEALAETVSDLHSYEVPSIVGVPVDKAAAAYQAWMCDAVPGSSSEF